MMKILFNDVTQPSCAPGWCTRGVGLLLGSAMLLWSALIGAQTFSVGVVPQFEPRKMFGIWQPLVDDLARRTGHSFSLVVPLTVSDFERELEKGSYDFVYANPYHILRVYPKQAYLPLVRDRTPLRGILLVRKDSPVQSLKELHGKSLAVPSPNALGASLLLRADLEHLHQVRMTMVNVKTHSSAYLNVLNGLTDAAGGVEKTLGEQGEAIRQTLKVIYTTRDMPSHPIAVHPRVRKEVYDKFRQGFFELAATPNGKKWLEDVPMTDPVATAIDDYLVMRQWGLESYWVGDSK
jgi:phosphonate transport system substrate-binding protein